jgi:quercetin dioxygenase-like cupin family protein
VSGIVTAFHPFDLTSAALVDLSHSPFPTSVATWNRERPLELHDHGTHFGFVFEGTATLSARQGTFQLAAGLYFAAPGPVEIRGGAGLVITALAYRGFFQIGGPIEETGRLRYIDGCTDSLLIPPVMLGEPCLNLLHIPPGTQQTAHTHPSLRVGLIVRGAGECVTPSGRFPLRPGLAFVIPEESLHSFHTSTEALLVIAYHPDSDFGPTHERHPMINRTIVPGRMNDGAEAQA